MPVRLVKRVEVRVPTLVGWALIAAICVAMGATLLLGAYPFLAVDAPIGGEILVVEGWLDRDGLLKGVDLYRNGPYKDIVATGIPVEEHSYLRILYPDLKTHAAIAARQFIEAGVDPAHVHAVEAPNAPRDRTFRSGQALRKWLVEHGRTGTRLDVFSRGPHARRTWMLFTLALDGVAEVGVIAMEPAGYDKGRWWTTSGGVRTMLSEMIAYGYAKLLFWP